MLFFLKFNREFFQKFIFFLFQKFNRDVVFISDSLFVLLRPGVAVPSRARAQNYPTQQNKQRIVSCYSQQLLSVDWP